MVISHGLEGSSDKYYVRRTADYFHQRGWDIAAWSCRSCSGEMNRLPRFYHHGETKDLGYTVGNVLDRSYQEVILFGYSMGASMSLKYLGEKQRDKRIIGAITFSVPCNLKESSDRLREKENHVYEKRFLDKLIEKIKLKAQMFPDQIDLSGLEELDNFDHFHERYTAPLHGFRDAADFFEQSTCDQFLSNITVPVLIVNALNDPMLGDKCNPRDIARESKSVHLETPKHGGHAGFLISAFKRYSWMEIRSEKFLNEVIL